MLWNLGLDPDISKPKSPSGGYKRTGEISWFYHDNIFKINLTKFVICLVGRVVLHYNVVDVFIIQESSFSNAGGKQPDLVDSESNFWKIFYF